MKSQVAVAICDSYERDKVYQAVKSAIDLLGGITAFAGLDEKILVKPNLLSPAEAEKAITTHPSVIGAVLRILSENRFSNVMLGDSAAVGSCRAALNKLGLTDGTLYGAAVASMNEEKLVEYPEGAVAKEFYFAREATEADAIIGVCKMKTHALERITGAVKNMYGLVCGIRKPAGHVKYPTASEFAKMLADIHNATPQRLHVMDAVVAMEGNGPASGNAIKMNMILASSDPVALDTVFCSLVHLIPGLVPTNVMGSLAGLGTMDVDEIEILLDEDGSVSCCSVAELVRRYGNPEFDVMRGRDDNRTMLGLLSRISGGSSRPVIDKSKCIRCGICVEHCPVEGKAVSFDNGRDVPPKYNYHRCIRCYCCQELCPQKAISVRRHLFRR